MLVCDSDGYRHVVDGTWQRGHFCDHPLSWLWAYMRIDQRCNGTYVKVRWTKALRAAERLGGAEAVEAMLNSEPLRASSEV